MSIVLKWELLILKAKIDGMYDAKQEYRNSGIMQCYCHRVAEQP